MSVLVTAVQGRHLHPGVMPVEDHPDGYRTFILQNTHNLTEQSPEEPVLSGCALSIWFLLTKVVL